MRKFTNMFLWKIIYFYQYLERNAKERCMARIVYEYTEIGVWPEFCKSTIYRERCMARLFFCEYRIERKVYGQDYFEYRIERKVYGHFFLCVYRKRYSKMEELKKTASIIDMARLCPSLRKKKRNLYS